MEADEDDDMPGLDAASSAAEDEPEGERDASLQGDRASSAGHEDGPPRQRQRTDVREPEESPSHPATPSLHPSEETPISNSNGFQVVVYSVRLTRILSRSRIFLWNPFQRTLS